MTTLLDLIKQRGDVFTTKVRKTVYQPGELEPVAPATETKSVDDAREQNVYGLIPNHIGWYRMSHDVTFSHETEKERTF